MKRGSVSPEHQEVLKDVSFKPLTNRPNKRKAWTRSGDACRPEMLELARNVSECPDIRPIWHLDPVPNPRNFTRPDIRLSHSDIGPYIHLICPEGYHVIGSNMITCLKGGVWDNTETPHCSPSSLYGIHQSTLLVICVLAGCGALVILTLTVILSNICCFRPTLPGDGYSSTERLRNSMETIASTSHYVSDQNYRSISAPQYPTMNGYPLIKDAAGNVFVHYSYDNMFQGDYDSHCETELDSFPSLSGSVRSLPGPRDNRTSF